MSGEDKFVAVIACVLLALIMFFVITMGSASERLDQYDDTIAEYVRCIKYNPDYDCSDIILSEYGEEVE